MREHINTMLNGLVADATRVQEIGASDPHASMAISLDCIERLAEERLWLAQQPVSSILDNQARRVLGRYRMLVVRTQLLAEHYIRTVDSDDIQPWLNSWADLIEMRNQLDSIPAD